MNDTRVAELAIEVSEALQNGPSFFLSIAGTTGSTQVAQELRKSAAEFAFAVRNHVGHSEQLATLTQLESKVQGAYLMEIVTREKLEWCMSRLNELQDLLKKEQQ